MESWSPWPRRVRKGTQWFLGIVLLSAGIVALLLVVLWATAGPSEPPVTASTNSPPAWSLNCPELRGRIQWTLDDDERRVLADEYRRRCPDADPLPSDWLD